MSFLCKDHRFSPSIISAHTNEFGDWRCDFCKKYLSEELVMNFLERCYDRVMGLLSKIHLPYMKLPNMEPETASNNI